MVSNFTGTASCFRSGQPSHGAELRLFCFPHAGGGASAYAQWQRLLSPAVEVVTVQLPGHESRISEPLCTEMSQLVALLQRSFWDEFQNLDRSSTPFVFFGHSMGALLAFELTRSLRRMGLPQPSLLIVSGHRAPHLPSTDEQIHLLSERHFLRKIAELDGTPVEILNLPEFREVWLPALRADFQLCETYRHASEPPFNLPIVALYGQDDQQVTDAEMQAWANQSRQWFSRYPLPGAHFYLHTHREQFMAELKHVLQSALTVTSYGVINHGKKGSFLRV